jgi:hypothetical protein
MTSQDEERPTDTQPSDSGTEPPPPADPPPPPARPIPLKPLNEGAVPRAEDQQRTSE